MKIEHMTVLDITKKAEKLGGEIIQLTVKAICEPTDENKAKLKEKKEEEIEFYNTKVSEDKPIW